MEIPVSLRPGKPRLSPVLRNPEKEPQDTAAEPETVQEQSAPIDLEMLSISTGANSREQAVTNTEPPATHEDDMWDYL